MANNIDVPNSGPSAVETRGQASGGDPQRQVVVSAADIIKSASSITPSSSAYSANQNVGGLLGITGFANSDTASGLTKGVLWRVFLKTNFAITVPMYLYLFSSQPSETFTDNTTMPTLGTTSIGYLFKDIPFTQFQQRGASQTLYQAEFENDHIPFVLPNGQTEIWAAIEIGGATTFGSSKFVNLEFYVGDQ